DAELFFRLVRDGHRIRLATDATVRSIMPASLRDAGPQAVRWERGKFDFARDVASLLRRGVLRRDRNALFAGLSGLTPPFAPLAILCLFLYVLRGAALGRMTPWVVMRILVWAPSYCFWKVGVLALAALGGGRGDWKRQRAGVSSVERPLTVD